MRDLLSYVRKLALSALILATNATCELSDRHSSGSKGIDVGSGSDASTQSLVWESDIHAEGRHVRQVLMRDEAGRAESESCYIDGALHGTQVKWTKDGDLYEIVQFRDDAMTGPYIGFYGDNQIRAIGQLRNGLEVDEWTYWHLGGQLAARFSCANGKRQGEWLRWWSNGKLRERGSYVGDEQDGIWEFFDADGALTRRETWHLGERTSP